MLGAFFDDSGTHSDSTVVVLGGLLGDEQQWDAFAQQWQALLDRPFEGRAKISDFHLTDCRNGYGEFQDWSQAERDHVNYLFREVILNSGFVTIAAAINKTAWDDLVIGAVAEKLDATPIEFCFVKCLDFVIKMIRDNKPEEKVFLLLDQGSRKVLEQWAWFYKNQIAKYPEIDDVAFGPVKKVIGLQGADMIAYETYKFAIEWFKDGTGAKGGAHFQPFRNHKLSVGLVYDAGQIAEMVDRVNSGVPLGWNG